MKIKMRRRCRFQVESHEGARSPESSPIAPYKGFTCECGCLSKTFEAVDRDEVFAGRKSAARFCVKMRKKGWNQG